MIQSQFDGNTALFISKGYTALSDLLKKTTLFFKAQESIFILLQNTHKHIRAAAAFVDY